MFTGGLKEAAHAAVRKIQARLEGAGAGRLSLARMAGEEGALSLPAGEAGGLAPATEPAAELNPAQPRVREGLQSLAEDRGLGGNG